MFARDECKPAAPLFKKITGSVYIINKKLPKIEVICIKIFNIFTIAHFHRYGNKILLLNQRLPTENGYIKNFCIRSIFRGNH